MKTRTSLVSNSSSSSFIVRGIKISVRDLCNLIDYKQEVTPSKIVKFIKEKFNCNLEIIEFKNYFSEEKYTDVIVGLHSENSLEDGEIVMVSPDDKIDNNVLDNLNKIGIHNPQLATWVQYVSNDNC